MKIKMLKNQVYLLMFITSVVTAGSISVEKNGATSSIIENTGASSVRRALGQTFVVPAPTAENQLNEFSFEFHNTGSNLVPDDLDYKVFVYEWDVGNSRATGAPLYESANLSSTVLDGMFVITFGGLSIDLDITKTYIAMITTQGVVNDTDTGVAIAVNNGNVYADGENWGLTSTSTLDEATTATWTVVAPTFDLDFNATFTDPLPVELMSFDVE